MSNKIIIVTAPDDSLIVADRICLVHLDSLHNQMISDFLKDQDFHRDIVLYSYNQGDPVNWIIDKCLKSRKVIFNADFDNPMINGYLCAHPNSHYFGTLKDLQAVNKNAIYDIQDLYHIFQ